LSDSQGNILEWDMSAFMYGGPGGWLNMNISSDCLPWTCMTPTMARDYSDIGGGYSGFAVIVAEGWSTSQGVWSVSEVLLPATLPLFATGLAALGLLGWRRKKKAQAAAA
jgi:hypothetical protein